MRVLRLAAVKPASHVVKPKKQPMHVVAPHYNSPYRCGGILKSRWLEKHMSKVPAVIILAEFVSEVATESWEQSCARITDRLMRIRADCEGRGTVVRVALVHKGRRLVGNAARERERDLAERVKVLRRAASLDAKHISVCERADLRPTPGLGFSPAGAVCKLRKACLEDCDSYYKEALYVTPSPFSVLFPLPLST